MTALPFRSDVAGGIVCLYAVIHLDAAQRAAAYASFRRVLRPGGIGLIAFHTRDADTRVGGEAILSVWWDEPVTLTFRFLDPSAESEALVAAGFELMARLDRAPGPGEHASERSYLMFRPAHLIDTALLMRLTGGPRRRLCSIGQRNVPDRTLVALLRAASLSAMAEVR